MKIAMCRMNNAVELDPALSVGQGVEHRRGLLHSLILQGYDVTIVSGLAKHEEHLLRSRSLTGDNWLSKLKYDLKATGSEFDTFILEGSSQVTTVTRNYDGVSNGTWNGNPYYFFIKGAIDKLKNFQGKVLFWNHIYASSNILPFDQSGYVAGRTKPLDQVSEFNWRRLLDGVDLFENKDWTVLHHCLNEQAFKQIHGRSPASYTYAQSPKLKFHYLHLPYSKLDPIYDVSYRPAWDSMYIGSRYSHSINYPEYDRLESIKRFYDSPKLTSAVIGAKGDFAYARAFRVDGGIPTAVSMWHNSYSHTFTESPTPLSVGSMTGRTFLSLLGGSILLLDKRIVNVSSLGLSEFEVSNADDVIDKVASFKQMSLSKRTQIRQEQLSTFPYWEDLDWQSLVL